MGPLTLTTRVSSVSGVAGKGGTEPDIEEVAAQFEALLIAQLMQGMKPQQDDNVFGSGDQSGATMMEFAQEHISRSIASSGGFGLAKLVASSLRQRSPASRTETATSVNSTKTE